MIEAALILALVAAIAFIFAVLLWPTSKESAERRIGPRRRRTQPTPLESLLAEPDHRALIKSLGNLILLSPLLLIAALLILAVVFGWNLDPP